MAVEQDVAVKTKETQQLCKEVILSQQTLRIMGIEGLKVLFSYVSLGQALLDVVLLENRVLNEVSIHNVVKDGVA